MIRLRLLGTVELRSDDARELRSVVVQPKRLALLAYLAATPRTEHRRDTLLGVFWPDLDAEHARGALSKALHYLRRSLGDDVIVGYGDETLHVDRERLWCDATAFEEALDEGRPDAALELYGGDFLKGFYLSDAEEFERWLDEHRDRLRRRAAEAARTLSRARETAGNIVGAIEYARRTHALTGNDEADLRRLVALLGEAGDRAGAVRVYDDFRRRIERDYDIAPSAETQALMARVRAAETPSTPAPGEAEPEDETAAHLAAGARPDRSDGASSAVTATAAPSHSPTPPFVRRRTAPRLATIGAVAAMLLAAAGVFHLLAPRSGAVAMDHQRVVVAPLSNRTGDERLDHLGDMAADWIIEGLARTRIASVVPFSAALASSRFVAEAGNIDGEGLARALARETGAGIVVTGSYYLRGDTIVLSAQISDGAGGAVLEAVEPVGTVAHDPSGAFDELRNRVMAGLGPHVNPRLREHAGVIGRTPSFDAYREYAAGVERISVHGDADSRSALDHFARAADLDPSYMLPLVRSAELYARMNNHAAADSLARLVEPHLGSLAEYDRLVITIAAARARGLHHVSFNAALRGARVAPNTILHFELARELLTQHRPVAALRVFSEVDPHRGELRGFAAYWVKRTEAHHLAGDYRGELRAARAARRLMPDYANAMRLEHRALVALGRVGEAQRVLDDFMSGPGAGHPQAGALMSGIALELRAHGYAAAARAVDERAIDWFLARPRHSPPHLADAYYQTGRWSEAGETLRVTAPRGRNVIARLGRLGTLAARTGDTDEAARIARQLADLDSPYLLGQNTMWRARIAALLGDRDQAVALLRDAYAEGYSWWLELHYDIDFESLRDHPPFQELIRPRG